MSEEAKVLRDLGGLTPLSVNRIIPAMPPSSDVGRTESFMPNFPEPCQVLEREQVFSFLVQKKNVVPDLRGKEGKCSSSERKRGTSSLFS